MAIGKILLIGGGGHCKSCIDVIVSTGSFEIVGILDNKKEVGSDLLGVPVIGTDENLEAFRSLADYALVTVGQIQSAALRKDLFQRLCARSYRLPTVVSPHATVSPHAVLGAGTIVTPRVMIGPDVSIAENAILNSGCIVEHDSQLGRHCHIATGAIVNGNCRLGDEVFLGSGSVVHQGVEICNSVVIAAGCVVRKNITIPGVYWGSPLQRRGDGA